MTRKTDLESHIRESSDLISQYETLLRLSSDPREKARARRAIDEQQELMRGHLAEYRRLCLAADQPMARDIAEIAASFDLAIEEQRRVARSEDAALPTIGIITALPKEKVAVEAMLDDPHDYFAAGEGYVLGTLPDASGSAHHVVLSRAVAMGNNPASAQVAILLRDFPSVASIIMIGIAAGAPYPEKAEEHVRLGDVVVSNEEGVVQYDFVKEEVEQILIRNRPRPPSARLLHAAKRIEEDELKGQVKWLQYIRRGAGLRDVERPAKETDLLVDPDQPERHLAHPIDPKRIEGQPRVFLGPIASANVLLKNARRRNALRDRYGVKAFEMEAAGVADTTWIFDKDYLVVRGICDYGDLTKVDTWQGYAAVAAAAYTRGLLEKLPA